MTVPTAYAQSMVIHCWVTRAMCRIYFFIHLTCVKTPPKNYQWKILTTHRFSFRSLKIVNELNSKFECCSNDNFNNIFVFVKLMSSNIPMRRSAVWNFAILKYIVVWNISRKYCVSCSFSWFGSKTPNWKNRRIRHIDHLRFILIDVLVLVYHLMCNTISQSCINCVQTAKTKKNVYLTFMTWASEAGHHQFNWWHHTHIHTNAVKMHPPQLFVVLFYEKKKYTNTNQQHYLRCQHHLYP